LSAMENSRKLVEAAFRGERPERTPIFDLILNDAVVERFAGRPLDGSDDRSVAFAAHANALDATRHITLPKKEGASYTDEYGNVWVSDRWTSWVAEPANKSLDDWAGFVERSIGELEAAAAAPVSETEIAAERESQRKFDAELRGTVYARCAPSTSVNAAMFEFHCPLDHFSFLWFDHKELVLRWFRAIEKRELRAIELKAHADISPVAVVYSDIAFKDRLMFGKEMFLEMGFFENLERLVHACHEKGMKVVFHSDGYVMEAMPDIVATGADGFNPIEKAAGMDIFELRRLYPELTLVGGVDVTSLLREGTPREMAKETRRIISEVGSEGRLLIGSTTEIGNDVPLENYLAFHNEAMKG